MPRPAPTPAPTNAAPLDPPPPMRIGGHGALDFLNSVFTPADRPIDLLADGAALLAWLRATDLLPPALVAAAASLGAVPADGLAAQARALRAWFRDALQRWTAGGAQALLAADLDHLNTLMARGDQRRRLVRTADGLSLASDAVGADAAAVLAGLAGLCADLLVSTGQTQVRRCENPACTLWFADTKRGPRRRWCAMAACGNRHKVAAHRARARGEAAGPDTP